LNGDPTGIWSSFGADGYLGMKRDLCQQRNRFGIHYAAGTRCEM